MFHLQFPNIGKLVDASFQTNIVLGDMRNSKPEVQLMKTHILSSSRNDCQQQLNFTALQSDLLWQSSFKIHSLFLRFVQHHSLFMREVSERTSREIKKIWGISFDPKIFSSGTCYPLTTTNECFLKVEVKQPNPS